MFAGAQAASMCCSADTRMPTSRSLTLARGCDTITRSALASVAASMSRWRRHGGAWRCPARPAVELDGFLVGALHVALNNVASCNGGIDRAAHGAFGDVEVRRYGLAFGLAAHFDVVEDVSHDECEDWVCMVVGVLFEMGTFSGVHFAL